jgi:predicted amidophosphoribosyltransferase
MLCQVCHHPRSGVVCGQCRSEMRPAQDRILPGGLRLVAAYEHTGPARALVHHLKYRGVAGYPAIVADALAGRVPDLPIVPVPRTLSRRIRYGVDPTGELARSLAIRVGVPVLPLLEAPFHARRRAGRDHARGVAPFRLRGECPSPVMILDDVVTTGTTLIAAAESIGWDRVALAVAANVVPQTVL